MKATRAFDILTQEWGEITQSEDRTYPIWFASYKGDYGTYTKDGRKDIDDKVPRLSLTEFNYVTGEGKFTPIDSEPEPQIGDEVWAWDTENSALFGKLTDKKNKCAFPFYVNGIRFEHISLTPPQWLIEKINKHDD